MANLLAPVAKAKFFDNNGRPANGYKLFTYAAGTSTKLATYTDDTTGTPNTNPVILNFRGEADIWLPPNTAYKFVFSPPTDSDPPTAAIWTVDHIVDSQLVTLWGGVDTGIANAYVLNFTANFTAYQDGIVIYWLPSNTNTGASTINVNGLGPVPITNQDGSALYFGQLQANQVALIVYRSTGFTLVATALLPLINTKNSNYTFVIGDGNNIVQHNDAAAYTYTVPTNASVPYPVGTSIDIINDSSALLTITPDVGVTIVPFGGNTTGGFVMSIRTSTRITKVNTNAWIQTTQSDLVYQQGTFAPTWTGFSVNPVGNVSYYVVGRTVTLYTTAGLIGTSNSTSLEINNCPLMPSALQIPCMITDNGAVAAGMIAKSGLSTLQFYKGTAPPSATGFTNAGNKGLPAGWSVTWVL